MLVFLTISVSISKSWPFGRFLGIERSALRNFALIFRNFAAQFWPKCRQLMLSLCSQTRA